MRDYEFLEPAQIELEEEVKYFNEQQAGLGYEFAKEIADTIARILRYPQAWTKLSKKTRRCRTKRFPYGVIYQIRDEKILIVAIAHLRREPFYWRDRIKTV
ncbi:MAG: type II toxin-antitoxin system RelE/ParE family toxin [Nitrospirota bacterium]